MNDLEVDSESQEEEIAIQNKINYLINNKQSLVFKAGAGSGKTYALIESLKYLLRIEGIKLKRENQKIIIITFTNVAADEIKERLGNSNLVLVSTIHERLWELIRNYQRELIDIHKEQLEEELEKLNKKINSEESFSVLKNEEQLNFIQVMEDNKNIFYKYYDEKVGVAKPAYTEIPFGFDIKETDLLKSIAKFRGIVNTLYLKRKYEKAIESIINQSTKYTEVNYNTSLSRDRLETMDISHDTLLKYGKKIIKNHKLLQQIIINKYPYFFVDEYQDTNQVVIEILRILHTFSKRGRHGFFVGYFGDEIQSIYADGIGNKLLEYHPELYEVNKKLNRRSTSEVINVINRVRNDEFIQRSVYKDAAGGSVQFYQGDKKYIINLKEHYQDKWLINEKNPLDVLVLTNRSVANYIGISDLYKVIQQSNLYSEGLGFQRLNEEMLSKQYDKLGEVQKSLYNLFKLLSLIKNGNKTVNNILVTESIRRNISLASLNNVIETLESIKGNTLLEILHSIDKAYRESENIHFKTLIEVTLNFSEGESFTQEGYKDFLLATLGKINDKKDITDDQQDERLILAKKNIESILSISKREFLKWYEYVAETSEESVRYHTYHGTKGLEFNNVIIIMENKFGNRSYFDKYFSNRLKEKKLQGEVLEDYISAKNLLYVATSRAIKNLVIYYVDSISNFEAGIIDIFGRPKKYPEVRSGDKGKIGEIDE